MQTIKPPIEGIESGLGKVESKSAPDAEDKLEDAAVEKAAAETQVLVESAKDKRQMRFLRRLYSPRFFNMTVIYLLFVACLIVCSGFKIWGFALDSKVLVALIGAPLLVYVVKYFLSSSR
jgi:hypothetical protein